MPKRAKRLTRANFRGVDDVRVSRGGKSIVLVRITRVNGRYKYYRTYYPNDAVNRQTCRQNGYRIYPNYK